MATNDKPPKWILLLYLIPVWFPPIWDSESERIGKQKCTPFGAMLHGVSDLFGLVSLISVPTVLIALLVELVKGPFQLHSLWLLLVPYVFTNIGRFLYGYSWKLAERNGFQYDDNRVASWVENGERRTFKHKEKQS